MSDNFVTHCEAVERTLPAFWAPALINRDFTGFDADYPDMEKICAFMSDFTELYGNCDPIDVSEESYFVKGHDAVRYGVLPCECFEYTFMPSIGEL
jgi:hypothetical protein